MTFVSTMALCDEILDKQIFIAYTYKRDHYCMATNKGLKIQAKIASVSKFQGVIFCQIENLHSSL